MDFNHLNKEDQTEFKKIFGSVTVNRKRKNDKTSSSTNDNGDAPKAKQSKIEEENQSTSEQDQNRQKKGFSRLIIDMNRLSSIFFLRNKLNYYGNIKMR